MCFGGDVLEVVAPFKEGTTAGRLLQKRGGDTGYMIIMQTEDADKRREYILKNDLAKVITYAKGKESTLVQYHPKGIKGASATDQKRRLLTEIPGGVMPELDSHVPTDAWPTPHAAAISPWGALGPAARAPLYMAAMRDAAHLRLVGVVLRLAPDDADTLGAARQWEGTFGVVRVGDGLRFTNARMGFVAGVRGESEGIQSVTVAVEGRERLERMVWAAKNEGVFDERGFAKMVGVRWYFVEAGESAAKKQ